MTTPMQMGAEKRTETETAPQQQADAPRARREARPGEDDAAPRQMGTPVFRDWAAI